ncbi:CCAAT/enhancer-binding protein delta [Geothlypis trichas]
MGCRYRRRGSAPRGRDGAGRAAGARKSPAPSRARGGGTSDRGHPRPGGGSSLRRQPCLRGRAPHPLPPPGPGGAGNIVPRHWGRRRGPRRISRDRAGVSLPGPETPCPIPASYRRSRRDPSPDRPPRGGDGGAAAAAPVPPSSSSGSGVSRGSGGSSRSSPAPTCPCQRLELRRWRSRVWCPRPGAPAPRPCGAASRSPMSAAALYSLDSPACYKNWCLEPANFYDAKVGSGGGPGPACKPGARGGCGMSGEEAGGGLGGSGTNLAELSAAAPAMYEDESAIDFSSYIDSMSAVPNLELCNDELFADLFNSNHKPERGGEYGEYLPPGGGAGRDPAKDLGAAMTTLLGSEPRTASSSSSSSSSSSFSSRGALKQEPDWSDSDLSSSLLPSQIATCAQTIMNLSGQPTPPTSPEPPGSSSPSSCSTRSPGPGAAAAAAPGPAQGVPQPAAAAGGGKERGGKKCVDRFSPEYRQRRERNNIAVRKSRDKAKRRNQEMQQKLLELSAENEKLHKKIEQLTRDLTSLRHFFKQLPSASFLQPGSGTDCR